MAAANDRETLLRLYESATSLRRRQGIFERSCRRSDSFVDWGVDLLRLTGRERVLDIGCGWGRFLLPVARRLSAGGFCIGVDLSAGMLRPAVEQLRKESLPAGRAVADVEDLPTLDGAFDIVMANHMLYHAQDIDGALTELRRVMRPAASLMATTNSDAVRPAVLVLHQRLLAEFGLTDGVEEQSPFSMESGLGPLQRHFAVVDRHYYRDRQRFENAEALLELYRSTGRYRLLSEREDLDKNARASLLTRARLIAEAMAEGDGSIRSPVLMGAFLARKA